MIQLPPLLHTISLPPIPSNQHLNDNDHASQRYKFEYTHSDQYLTNHQNPNSNSLKEDEEEQFYMDLLNSPSPAPTPTFIDIIPRTSSSPHTNSSIDNQTDIPDLVSSSYESTSSYSNYSNYTTANEYTTSNYTTKPANYTAKDYTSIENDAEMETYDEYNAAELDKTFFHDRLQTTKNREFSYIEPLLGLLW